MANYVKLYTIIHSFEQFRTIVDNFWKMMTVLKTDGATKENKHTHADMHAHVSKESSHFVTQTFPSHLSHMRLLTPNLWTGPSLKTVHRWWGGNWGRPGSRRVLAPRWHPRWRRDMHTYFPKYTIAETAQLVESAAILWDKRFEVMPITQQYHGDNMALTWQSNDGNKMAITWQHHGNNMAMTWQWHSSNSGSSSSRINAHVHTYIIYFICIDAYIYIHIYIYQYIHMQ